MDLNSITKASFSWQIQRPGDYPEQAQDMGLIDKDQALKACQSFPWSKELSSKIIFNTDTRQLIITRSYDGIFTVEYANFKKKRFTEFTFTKEIAKGDLTFTQVIAFYFDDTLDQHGEIYKWESEGGVSLDIPPNIKYLQNAKEDSLRKNLELSLSPGHLAKIGGMTIFWFLVSLTFLIMSVVLMKPIGILVSIPVSFAWLPTFYIHLSYYLQDRYTQVTIDYKNHFLTYRNGEKEIKFGRKDLQNCKIVEGDIMKTSAAIGDDWNNYSHVLFTLRNRSQVVITCFIAEPYQLVSTLHCPSDTKQMLLARIKMDKIKNPETFVPEK